MQPTNHFTSQIHLQEGVGHGFSVGASSMELSFTHGNPSSSYDISLFPVPCSEVFIQSMRLLPFGPCMSVHGEKVAVKNTNIYSD